MLIPSDPNQDLIGLVALLAMLCATAAKANCSELLLHLPLHLQGQVIPKLLKTSPLSATAGLLPMHRDLVEELRAAMPPSRRVGGRARLSDYAHGRFDSPIAPPAHHGR